MIIGAGPSGLDMAYDVAKFASSVTLSHHMNPPPTTPFPDNVNIKPDVKRFTETGVVFEDDTEQSYTIIFYCTGFKFTFPFLSVDCSIHVDENFIQPLYKHCINVNHPTMSIIGLPYFVCQGHLTDLQARFAIKYLLGELELPSREEMLLDSKNELNKRLAIGWKKRHAHQMNDFQVCIVKYFNENII